MGLFDLFKKKDKTDVAPKVTPVKTSVPESEKKFYQPDSYYTDVVAEGTAFERRVITFEERKKTAIPSKRGLYPAEILLLEYCSKGTYPGPKNGYPGFWWFSYGIRDVGAALKSLEDRGYIAWGSVRDAVGGFTVAQLKDLLISQNMPTTGKKADLVERVLSGVPDEALIAAGAQRKYILTETGRLELDENAYVPYMHSVPNKTTEDARLGMTFNVWSINKLLGTGDKSAWRDIVDEQERKINQETADRNAAFMHDLKRIAPDEYRKLRTQDQQIAAVQKAREQYDTDKDLSGYIDFWEMVWANGGLKFEGAGWHFELPDLYIKAKRYDDALAFVKRLKVEKPTYAYKADTYIKKIEEMKAKLQRKEGQ